MKVDSKGIYFPRKKLKDVYVGQCFYIDQIYMGYIYTKILHNIDHEKFYIMCLNSDEFFEVPTEWMDKDVFLVDAIMTYKMIDRDANERI